MNTFLPKDSINAYLLVMPTHTIMPQQQCSDPLCQPPNAILIPSACTQDIQLYFTNLASVNLKLHLSKNEMYNKKNYCRKYRKYI